MTKARLLARVSPPCKTLLAERPLSDSRVSVHACCAPVELTPRWKIEQHDTAWRIRRGAEVSPLTTHRPVW